MPEDAAVIDVTTDESAAGEQQQEQGGREQREQQHTDKGQGKEKGTETTEKIDGRRAPDAIKKSLLEMRSDTDPAKQELAKNLTNIVGKARAYEQEFPTVREAREVKAALELVGGREGLVTLQETRATMQRVDAALEAGDPSVLEDIFKQAPEGILKLVPHILDRMEKADPEAYAKAMQPRLLATLDGANFPGAYNGLVDAYDTLETAARSGDKTSIAHALNAFKNILGGMGKWYNGVRQGSAEPKADPAREQFEKEKTDFQKQQDDQVIKQTFSAQTLHAGNVIDKALAPEIKRLGLSPKAAEKLRQDIWREFQDRRKADKTYTGGLSQHFDGRKPKDSALKYMTGYIDRTLGDVIKEEVATRYGNVKTTAKKDVTAPKGNQQQQRQQAPQGVLMLTKMPERHEIDYNDRRTKPTDGVVVRKSDGRLVTWPR